MSSDQGKHLPPRATLFTRDFCQVCLATLLSASAQYLVLTAIPLYLRQLGLPDAMVGGYIGLFALGALVTRFPVGAAIDRWGARVFGIGGTGVLAFSFLLYALAPTVPFQLTAIGTVPLLLPVAGLAHSVGFGGYGTSANAFVAYTVPAPRRGEAVAYFGVLMNIAMSLGGGVSFLVFTEWGSGALLGIGAAMALLSALLWWSLRSAPYMIEHDARANKFGIETKVLVPSFANTALAAGNGAAIAFIPLFGLERGIGNPGLYFSAVAITSILARLLFGRLADIWGRFASIIPGMLVAGVGYVLVAQASSDYVLALSGAVVGMGVATAAPALQALAIDLAGPSQRGAAMATYWAMVDLGVSIGSMAAGQIAQYVGYGGVFVAASVAPLIGVAGIGLSIRAKSLQSSDYARHVVSQIPEEEK